MRCSAGKRSKGRKHVLIPWDGLILWKETCLLYLRMRSGTPVGNSVSQFMPQCPLKSNTEKGINISLLCRIIANLPSVCYAKYTLWYEIKQKKDSQKRTSIWLTGNQIERQWSTLFCCSYSNCQAEELTFGRRRGGMRETQYSLRFLGTVDLGQGREDSAGLPRDYRAEMKEQRK